MTHQHPIAVVAAFILILLAALFRPVQASQPLACFSDWSTAAPIAQKEGLLTLDRLSAHVATRYEGRLLKAVLCRTDERFVYRIVLRQGNGRLDNLIVDARPIRAR